VFSIYLYGQVFWLPVRPAAFPPRLPGAVAVMAGWAFFIKKAGLQRRTRNGFSPFSLLKPITFGCPYVVVYITKDILCQYITNVGCAA
jgi:hypothetical protein